MGMDSTQPVSEGGASTSSGVLEVVGCDLTEAALLLGLSNGFTRRTFAAANGSRSRGETDGAGDNPRRTSRDSMNVERCVMLDLPCCTIRPALSPGVLYRDNRWRYDVYMPV